MYLGIPEHFTILAEMVSCCKQKARRFVLAGIPTQTDAVDRLFQWDSDIMFSFIYCNFLPLSSSNSTGK